MKHVIFIGSLIS